MPVVKWKIGGVNFSVNPQRSSISRRKRFYVLELIDGNPVFQEGRDEVPTLQAEITVLSETAYQQFMDWYSLGGILTLIDDHNDSFSVVIESIDLARENKASHSWFYRGTLTMRIMSGL